MRRGILGRHIIVLRRCLMVGALGLSAVGCANSYLWDDITSHDFKFKDLYTKSDPMTVLRDNQDGDARARAMKALKEPDHNNRPADQDEAVKILTEAAVSDPRPLVRLAAIDALGRFSDPRCALPLVQAYQSAGSAQFSLEHVTSIRCEAIVALGKKKTPEAQALLIQVASEPKTEKTSGVQLTGLSDNLKRPTPVDDEDPAQRMMRLAAIRSLGEQGNRQAVPILIPMLAEKDVAVRDRAHEALQKLTGRKDVPPEVDAWKAAVGGAPAANTAVAAH